MGRWKGQSLVTPFGHDGLFFCHYLGRLHGTNLYMNGLFKRLSIVHL